MNRTRNQKKGVSKKTRRNSIHAHDHDKEKIKIQGEIKYEKQGWKVIHVYGDAYERGYAHGYLLKKEMAKIPRVLKFVVKHEIGVNNYKEYSSVCKKVKPIIKKHFAELYEELEGMVKGANNPKINIDTLIEWNSVLSMYSHFESNSNYENETDKRCSAFIATGDATRDGKIVMAHNTHSDFVSGFMQNIVQYMTPSRGTPFVMQCAPGFIASGTDWFICKNGMVGCECTIGDMKEKPEFGYPYYCRIRMAMQYGNSIDDYIQIMLDHNAGDYACSWMFGNLGTNEIALLELGKNNYSIQRTISGVYYGMNSAVDYKVRTLDTNDADIRDLSTSSGSRNSRLDYLLNTKYYGVLDKENAKIILADHYDSLLNKVQMGPRGICNHGEVEVCDNLEGECDFSKWETTYPYGCTDGKVGDSEMMEKLEFEGRFGSSCGREFDANEYIRDHGLYSAWSDVLTSVPRNDWVVLK